MLTVQTVTGTVTIPCTVGSSPPLLVSSLTLGAGYPTGFPVLSIVVGPAGPVTVPTGREGGLTQEFYSGPVSMPRGY